MIDYDETHKILVEIYSMLGEKVLHQEFEVSRRYEFDLSGRPAGIYLVRVIRNEEMGVIKIVKQ
jgi:hypothetical protein